MTREQREKIAQKVKYITAGSEDKWEAAGITSPNPMIQTILVTFQKILDPTSVVRESEYARSATGVSALRRIEGAIQNFIKGGAVSVSEVKDIYLLAEKFYQNARLSHSKNTLPFLKRAARNPGIRVDEIFALDIYDLYGLKYNASKKEIMNFIDQIDTGEVDLKTLILSTNPYDKRAEIDTITPSEGVPSSVITPQKEKQNKLEEFGFTGTKKTKKTKAGTKKTKKTKAGTNE
jgi:hypothetical protein